MRSVPMFPELVPYLEYLAESVWVGFGCSNIGSGPPAGDRA